MLGMAVDTFEENSLADPSRWLHAVDDVSVTLNLRDDELGDLHGPPPIATEAGGALTGVAAAASAAASASSSVWSTTA